MEMEITFPENMKCVAKYGKHEIVTDQSIKSGGDDSAPEPLKLFLASLGTCAGIYILSFIEKRELITEGLKIKMTAVGDKEKKMYTKIIFDVQLPKDFPEKYKNAVIKSADLCAVKKHIFEPPEFETNVSFAQ